LVSLPHAVFACRAPEQQQLQQRAEDGTAAGEVLPHRAAVALLHFAANHSMRHEEMPTVSIAVDLARALLACSSVQQDLERNLRSQLPAWRQPEQQQPGRAGSQPQSSACDSEDPLSEGCQQDTMQWWMTGELLEQALELTSTFVQKFSALLMSGEAAGAGKDVPAASPPEPSLSPGGSSSGNSSSGGRGRGNSSSSSVPCRPKASDGISNTRWTLFKLVVELQHHAHALHFAELRTRAGSSPQDTQQHTSGSKAWAKHCLLLMRPVEAFGRFDQPSRRPCCRR